MEENKITVVQALDERDLLVRKIKGKIQKAQLIDLVRPKAAVTWLKRRSRTAFVTEAQSSLQQIQDLIARYDLLNTAIALSNATTYLETSRGRMTISGAIALRNRLRGRGPFGELTDFEGMLAQQMEKNFRELTELQRKKNEALRREKSAQKKGDSGAEIILLQSAGRMEKEAEALRTEKAGKEKNTELLRIFDPLHTRKMAEEIIERREALLAELETKIKISNATTYVAIGRGGECAFSPIEEDR